MRRVKRSRTSHCNTLCSQGVSYVPELYAGQQIWLDSIANRSTACRLQEVARAGCIGRGCWLARTRRRSSSSCNILGTDIRPREVLQSDTKGVSQLTKARAESTYSQRLEELCEIRNAAISCIELESGSEASFNADSRLLFHPCLLFRQPEAFLLVSLFPHTLPLSYETTQRQKFTASFRLKNCFHSSSAEPDRHENMSATPG